MGKYRVNIFFGEDYEDAIDLCIGVNEGVYDIDKKFYVSEEISEKDLRKKIIEEINNLIHGSQSKNQSYGKSAGLLGRIHAFVYSEYGDLVKIYTVDGMLKHPYMGKSSNVPKPVMRCYNVEEFYKENGLSEEEIRQESQRLTILNVSDALISKKQYGFMGVCLTLAETVAGYEVIKNTKNLPIFLSLFAVLGVLLGIDLISFFHHMLKIKYFKNKLENLEQDPEKLKLLANDFSTYVRQQYEEMFLKQDSKNY